MINIKTLKELSQDFSVLYLEDDTAIRNSMATYLQKFFAKVVSGEDGIVGLQHYKKEKFDIVITDLSMPNLNGLEMLKKIKEIHEDQAVLITSAHSESEYMIGAIKIGIDGYVIKPFDFEQLNKELYKIVEKLHKFAQNKRYKENLEEMVKQKTKELQEMLTYETQNYEQTIYSMIEMIEDRDTYTAGHAKRVAQYSKMIAEEMGYSEEDCTKIYQAGILHDIGKIATPDSVLLNPKKLNDIEYKLIQEHVEVGYKLLNHIPMFQPLANIVRSHHERYDGTGYPKGLSGDEIDPLARIMMVADAFDAMTTNRIYKARKSLKKALKEIQDLQGIQFHPEVVAPAIRALQSIHIDKQISQLPKSILEQERFAYFYKDTLSNVYNQNYLDVVLMKNTHEKEFQFLNIFYLKNFSQFNKEESWKKGDELLKEFATILNEYFQDSLTFRVFGDDFVVLSRTNYDTTLLDDAIEELLNNTCVNYLLKQYNLHDTPITNLLDINKN